jgi:hypothetical protein
MDPTHAPPPPSPLLPPTYSPLPFLPPSSSLPFGLGGGRPRVREEEGEGGGKGGGKWEEGGLRFHPTPPFPRLA